MIRDALAAAVHDALAALDVSPLPEAIHLERPALRRGPAVEAAGDRLEELARRHLGRAQAKAPFVEAGEHEQILCEPREPVDLVPGRPQGLLELARRPLVA